MRECLYTLENLTTVSHIEEVLKNQTRNSLEDLFNMLDYCTEATRNRWSRVYSKLTKY